MNGAVTVPIPVVRREGLRRCGELLIDEIRPRAVACGRAGLIDDEIGRVGGDQRIDGDACGQPDELRPGPGDRSGVGTPTPSVNSGNSALPPASDVTVAIADRRIDVDGIGGAIVEDFERRPAGIGRRHAGAGERGVDLRDHRRHAAEKSMPNTVSFAVAVAVLGNGSALGSSTRTSVMVCCVLVRVSV